LIPDAILPGSTDDSSKLTLYLREVLARDSISPPLLSFKKGFWRARRVPLRRRPPSVVGRQYSSYSTHSSGDMKHTFVVLNEQIESLNKARLNSP
jgi:hypothetical protein